MKNYIKIFIIFLIGIMLLGNILPINNVLAEEVEDITGEESSIEIEVYRYVRRFHELFSCL